MLMVKVSVLPVLWHFFFRKETRNFHFSGLVTFLYLFTAFLCLAPFLSYACSEFLELVKNISKLYDNFLCITVN